MRALLIGIDTSTWSQISAVVFGLFFLALAIWVFHPAQRTAYQRAEKLPLED